MEVQKIGQRVRTFAFHFEFNQEPISVLVVVIDGATRRFVIDTALGPQAIGKVAAAYGPNFWDVPLVVANSHSHFDHFWGNVAFRDQLIIGHALCYEEILKPARNQFLMEHPEYRMGRVTIVPPNLTFEHRLLFPDDGIEFFHSPGHSRDSISCLDRVNGLLLVGDNVGLPIPSIYPGVTLETYIETLETYQALNVPTIIASHYGVVDPGVLEDHLVYLRLLRDGDAGAYENGVYAQVHNWNLEVLGRV